MSKATFDSLLPDYHSSEVDYTALNVFLPHLDYAKQHFICILNPSSEREAMTKQLIVEAHGIAVARLNRKLLDNPAPELTML